jgi:hypothetical protein
MICRRDRVERIAEANFYEIAELIHEISPKAPIRDIFSAVHKEFPSAKIDDFLELHRFRPEVTIQKFLSLIRKFCTELKVRDAVGVVHKVCPEMKVRAGLEWIVRAFPEVHFSKNMQLWDAVSRVWPEEAAAARDIFGLTATPLPFTSGPLRAL